MEGKRRCFGHTRGLPDENGNMYCTVCGDLLPVIKASKSGELTSGVRMKDGGSTASWFDSGPQVDIWG